MKIRIALLVAAIMLCSTNVRAQDEARKVIGPTASTCGTWTEGRSNRSTMVYAQLYNWAMGFASGVNFNNGNDFLRNIDADAISGWLNNYFREHPLHTFTKGVVALTIELRKPTQPK